MCIMYIFNIQTKYISVKICFRVQCTMYNHLFEFDVILKKGVLKTNLEKNIF